MMPVKVVDYEPAPVDSLRANWSVYSCVVEFADGSTKAGTIQGDTHIWAMETFEEE